MRNLKRALSLALASVMLLGMMVVGTSAAYVDVDTEDNIEAIEVLQEVGIMVGDENNNFNPDAPVTRQEMAVVLSNLMDYRVASYKGTCPFGDVADWAEPYVAACYTNELTAGMGANYYGAKENVTTAQAALMLMKVLGYFQYQSDFEDDWQLATVSQGNKIDLFEDVESGVSDPMTRNDLAQLVLNVLEAGTVEADDDTIKVQTQDGTKVEAGKVKYNYVTSGKDYAEAINDDLYTGNSGEYSNGSIVELGEKLYQGDLKKTAGADDFGRPADIWEYQAKEIGTYSDKADYSFTAKVTSKALYAKVGKTACEKYDWFVSLNGEPVEYDGYDLSAHKSDNDKDFVAKAGGAAATGNGVLTEVFVDGTDEQVHIAMIYAYSAEVLKVDEDDGTITLSDLDNGPADTDDLYITDAFEEDDIVVYTYADGEIQSVANAERIEGEVTRVRSNTSKGEAGDGDNFIMDGTTYKYTNTLTSGERLTEETVNNDMVGYLDTYGYVVYIDESEVTYDYAYVLTVGSEGEKYDKNVKNETAYARLILTDGTMVKAELDDKYDDMSKLEGHLVSYSVDKNDVYTLTDLKDREDAGDSKSADDVSIENGKAGMILGDSYAANSNTIFVLVDPDEDDYDDYDISVFTGYKNVPDVDAYADSTTHYAVVTGKNSGPAKVVYVENGDVGGTDDVIYVVANSAAKLQKDSEIGSWFELDAVIDGAKTTLQVKQSSTAADKLVKDIDTDLAGAISGTKFVVAVKSLTMNSDGLVTGCKLYEELDADKSGVIVDVATAKSEDETVGLAGKTYAYDEDVVVAFWDIDDAAVKMSRINAIKDDTNNKFVAILDENVVTGIFAIEVDGGENGEKEEKPVATNYKVVGLKDAEMSVSAAEGAITLKNAKVNTEDDEAYAYGSATLTAVIELYDQGWAELDTVDVTVKANEGSCVVADANGIEIESALLSAGDKIRVTMTLSNKTIGELEVGTFTATVAAAE